RQLAPARPQRESRTMIDYNEKDRGGAFAEDEHKYAKLLRTKRFAPNNYVNGESVTLEWLRLTGMKEPFLVEEPDGLDMKMPPRTLTVDQVADACGRDKIVDAMEVLTQADKQMTLDDWASYFTQPIEKRKRLLNVISLEIGSTKLSTLIQRPRIVRQLDWTETIWPPRSQRPEFPRVQLYCLILHIDFGGSSVFYHLLSGEKHFYFIRPTPVNLKKYEKWSTSPDQGTTFFGDESDRSWKHHVYSSGWIHAVYTPRDSIVIGGNFLQGMDMGMQIQMYELENRTDVPLKFRFPYFVEMQWYAAKHYLKVLQNPVAEFLLVQVEYLNGQDVKARKLARLSVPQEFKNVGKLAKSFEKAVVRRQMVLMEGELEDVVKRMTSVRDSQLETQTEAALNNVAVKEKEKGIKIRVKRPLIDAPEDEEVWNSGESEAENYQDDGLESEDDDYMDGLVDEVDDDALLKLEEPVRKKPKIILKNPLAPSRSSTTVVVGAVSENIHIPISRAPVSNPPVIARAAAPSAPQRAAVYLPSNKPPTTTAARQPLPPAQQPTTSSSTSTAPRVIDMKKIAAEIGIGKPAPPPKKATGGVFSRLNKALSKLKKK
ncbi:hypothetical protein BCR33DRAFT_715425, partial [Rhizoclosmatium globosum]